MESRTDDLVPQRTLISMRREYQAAVDTLLPLAAAELRVFDPDLSDLGLNSPERVEALRLFLQRSRSNRLFIVLHSIDYVTRKAPRLLQLLGPFSREISIHRTTGDAARVQDCFVLCDELHFVRRAVAAQPRGALYMNDAKEASGMRERFDQIWESSELAISASHAGLG